MEFWQTIIATLVGGSITLIATVLANHYQKRREDHKTRLEKIERAYVILTQIEHSYRMQWACDTVSLTSGKYQEQYYPKEQVPFEELEMLTAFYAKVLLKDVEELVSYARRECGRLSIKIADVESGQIGDTQALKEEVLANFNEMKKKISSLRSRLVSIGIDCI